MSENIIDLSDNGEPVAEVISDIVAPSALEAIQRAEVDVAITTAKRYPRDIARCLKTCRELALRNPKIAERCNYAVPRAGKRIIGPSVHFARIVAYSWGNASALSRVVGCDHENAHIQGVFHDLQTNMRIGIEMDWPVQPPKDPTPERWKDQMTLAKRAGAAVGLRVAIFNVIPMVLFEAIAEEAKTVAAGTEKTFEERRNAAIAECKALGVTQGMIYRALERNGLEAITTDDLIYLHGLLTSIADGTLNVFDAFGHPEKPTVKAEVPKTAAAKTKAPPAETTKSPEPREPAAETKKAEAEAKPEKRPEQPETKPAETVQAGLEQDVPPKKEKAKAAKAEPAQAEPQPQGGPVAAIRAKLIQTEISEEQLIGWLNDIGTVPDGTTSLEQVNAKWLKMILEDWAGILDQVKAFQFGAAK